MDQEDEHEALHDLLEQPPEDHGKPQESGGEAQADCLEHHGLEEYADYESESNNRVHPSEHVAEEEGDRGVVLDRRREGVEVEHDAAHPGHERRLRHVRGTGGKAVGAPTG